MNDLVIGRWISEWMNKQINENTSVAKLTDERKSKKKKMNGWMNIETCKKERFCPWNLSRQSMNAQPSL